MLDLFTRESHHRHITVLYLCRDLFPPGKFAKTISRNAHYVIVFKNPRDQTGCRALVLQALSRSMARRPQTLCSVHATSFRVSHDRPSSCLRRPIPVVQSCDTAGRSHGGVRAPMSSSWAKTNDIKGGELH